MRTVRRGRKNIITQYTPRRGGTGVDASPKQICCFLAMSPGSPAEQRGCLRPVLFWVQASRWSTYDTELCSLQMYSGKECCSRERKKKKLSAGPCPITLIHLSCVASIFHIPLPFMCKSTAVDKHLGSTMIYWPLITTSETRKASSSVCYEGALWRGWGGLQMMLTHHVYTKTLSKVASFKSDIYSTVTKSTVLALHWEQWILRQFVKSYTNNCISVRHYSSSSPKYGLTIHTLLSHKCMKAIPMP